MKRKTYLVFLFMFTFLLFVSCGGSKSKKNNVKTSKSLEETSSEVVESSQISNDTESSISLKDDESSKDSIESNSKESISNVESILDESKNESSLSNSNIESSSSESTLEDLVNVTIKFVTLDYSNNPISESFDSKEYGEFSESTKIKKGESLKLTGSLNPGYNFIGWYYNSSRKSSQIDYTFNDIIEDIVIEARFKAKQFELSVVSANPLIGKISVNDEDYTDTYTKNNMYNSLITLKTNGDKDLLDGWYINNEKVSSELTYSFNMPSSELTVEVRWNIFIVNYDLNGGDYNNENNIQLFTSKDDDFVLLDPSYEGYDFLGWYDGDTKVEVIDTSAKSNYNLVAKWAPSTNTKYRVCVMYYDNELYKDIEIEDSSYDLYGTTNELTNATYIDILGYTPKNNPIEQKTILRDGSTVVYIYYSKNYSRASFVFSDINAGYIDRLDSYQNFTGSLYYGTEIPYEITLFAGYSLVGVYDSENNLVSDSLEFDLIAPPVDETYTIVTEKNSFKLNTYQSLINDKGYEITFDSNGGTEVEKQYSNSLVFPYTEKEDSLFRGWAKSSTSTSTYSLQNGFTSDTTLYALYYDDSKWYSPNSSYLDYENVTLGHVNGTFEVSQKVEYNKYGYGGWLAFTPYATGSINIYVSGYKYRDIKLYEGNMNTSVSLTSKGTYLETAKLYTNKIYYINLLGYYGYSNYIRLEGAYPSDFRDFSSNVTYLSDGVNKLYDYADISVYKNQEFNLNDTVLLTCETKINSYDKCGYDNIFIGWYDLDLGEYVSHDLNYELKITKNTNLECRYKKLEIGISSNVLDANITYSTNILDLGGIKYGDTVEIIFEIEKGLIFNAYEYRDESYSSSSSTNVIFELYLDEFDYEIYFDLSKESYNFNVTGDVANVTLNGNYNDNYYYLDEVNVSVLNDSGHTIKWYINDKYASYGDSLVVIITDKTNIRYELSNVDLFDNDTKAYYGTYPKTSVESNDLISELNSKITVPSSYKSTSTTLPSGWVDSNYYNYNAQYNKYRVMVYTDITYNGSKYRGIYLYNYRSVQYIGGASSGTPNQQTNGYSLNQMYWFKFEAIEWDVLNISDDGVINLASTYSIDSYQYANGKNSDVYSHNGYDAYCVSYQASDLRKWLNGNFYNLAFSDAEKTNIVSTTLDGIGDYSPNATSDYVYILSMQEIDDYEYNGDCVGTDYALSQGYNNTDKAFWTRTPYTSNMMYRNHGSMAWTYYTSNGVKPVINVNI